MVHCRHRRLHYCYIICRATYLWNETSFPIIQNHYRRPPNSLCKWQRHGCLHTLKIGYSLIRKQRKKEFTLDYSTLTGAENWIMNFAYLRGRIKYCLRAHWITGRPFLSQTAEESLQGTDSRRRDLCSLTIFYFIAPGKVKISVQEIYLNGGGGTPYNGYMAPEAYEIGLQVDSLDGRPREERRLWSKSQFCRNRMEADQKHRHFLDQKLDHYHFSSLPTRSHSGWRLYKLNKSTNDDHLWYFISFTNSIFETSSSIIATPLKY